MRAELVPFQQNRNEPVFCDFCAKIGYVQFNGDHQQTLEKLNYTVSKSVVLHVGWLKRKDCENHLAELKNRKRVYYVGCQFCVPHGEVSSEFKQNCALVIKDLSALKTADGYAEVYLITENFSKTWEVIKNVKKFEKLKLLAHYQPWFNQQASIQKELLQIKRTDSTFRFGTPFNTDVLDSRNFDHINWVFKPNETFKISLVTPEKIEISIIIPFHERSELVAKVIRSLYGQTFERVRFEVILLDDGSSPSSHFQLKEKLRAFDGMNLSLHYLPRKVALAKSNVDNRVGPVRNLGGHLARGSYLLFMDSDILLPPEYLSKLLLQFKNFDVVMPIRRYLNATTTQIATGKEKCFNDKDLLVAPWDQFMNLVYQADDWGGLEFPWKFFMTYCLAMPKSLFFKTGGFRTNYISYGYEDLDLGFRTFQISTRAKLLPIEVFHLYHFQNGAEYDLKSFRRYYHLAMTSRVFVMQNLPSGAHDLQKMLQFRSWQAKAYHLLQNGRYFF